MKNIISKNESKETIAIKSHLLDQLSHPWLIELQTKPWIRGLYISLIYCQSSLGFAYDNWITSSGLWSKLREIVVQAASDYVRLPLKQPRIHDLDYV